MQIPIQDPPPAALSLYVELPQEGEQTLVPSLPPGLPPITRAQRRRLIRDLQVTALLYGIVACGAAAMAIINIWRWIDSTRNG
jgi:hypothetical protein